MAVPTITTITPAVMRSRGGSLITIDGTNFREYTAVPLTGPTDGILIPPVKVTIDGEPCTELLSFSDTRVTCLVPGWRGGVGSTQTTDPLPLDVDVVLENIDDDGVLIPGETVTEVDGFRYKRDATTHAARGWISTVSVELRRFFARYVLQNTKFVPHTEVYDQDATLRQLQLSEPPALVMTGPSIRENRRGWSSNHLQQVTTGATTLDLQRRHYVVDLTFDLIGLSNSLDQLINLAELCLETVHAQGYLYVDPLSVDPSTVRRKYTLRWVQEPDVQREPNLSNLATFESRIIIEGVDVDTYDVLGQAVLTDDDEDTPTLEVDGDITI
jgi:hypothetical protein